MLRAVSTLPRSARTGHAGLHSARLIYSIQNFTARRNSEQPRPRPHISQRPALHSRGHRLSATLRVTPPSWNLSIKYTLRSSAGGETNNLDHQHPTNQDKGAGSPRSNQNKEHRGICQPIPAKRRVHQPINHDNQSGDRSKTKRLDQQHATNQDVGTSNVQPIRRKGRDHQCPANQENETGQLTTNQSDVTGRTTNIQPIRVKRRGLQDPLWTRKQSHKHPTN